MTETEQAITWSPPNPKRGDTIVICCTEPWPRTIELDWDPLAEPTSVTVTGLSDGCAQVVVPENASTVFMHDTSGLAEDESIIFGG